MKALLSVRAEEAGEEAGEEVMMGKATFRRLTATTVTTTNNNDNNDNDD